MPSWLDDAPLATESQIATLERPAAQPAPANAFQPPKSQQSFLDDAPVVPVQTAIADYDNKSKAALVQRARKNALSEPFEVSDVHGPRPRLNTPDVEQQATEHLKEFPGVNPIEVASVYQRAKHYYRLAAHATSDIEPAGPRRKQGRQTITESKVTSNPAKLGGENLEQLQKTAAQVPPEDRPMFLGIMADYMSERQKKAPARTFSEKFLERVNRGVSSVPNALMSLPKYFGGDTQAADDWRFMQQIRGIKQGYDPATVDNWLWRGLLGAAEMAPPMLMGGMLGAGAGAGVGALAGEAAGETAAGVAGVSFWSGQEAPGLYEEMRDQGINHDTAAKIALVTAPIIGGIEAVQVGQAAKPFETGAKAMAKKAFLKSMAKELIKTNVKENIEEDVQNAIGVAAKAYGTYLDRNAKDIDWKEEGVNFATSALDTALAMPFIQGPGAAVGGVKGYRQNSKLLSLLELHGELTAPEKSEASKALDKLAESAPTESEQAKTPTRGLGSVTDSDITSPTKGGSSETPPANTPPVTEGTPDAQRQPEATQSHGSSSPRGEQQSPGPGGEGIRLGGQSVGQVQRPSETQQAANEETPSKEEETQVNPYSPFDARYKHWQPGQTEPPPVTVAKKTVGEIPNTINQLPEAFKGIAGAIGNNYRDRLWEDAQAIAGNPKLPKMPGAVIEQAVDKAARAGLLDSRETFDAMLDRLTPHADAPYKEQAKIASQVLNQMRGVEFPKSENVPAQETKTEQETPDREETPAPKPQEVTPPATSLPLVPDRDKTVGTKPEEKPWEYEDEFVTPMTKEQWDSLGIKPSSQQEKDAAKRELESLKKAGFYPKDKVTFRESDGTEQHGEVSGYDEKTGRIKVDVDTTITGGLGESNTIKKKLVLPEEATVVRSRLEDLRKAAENEDRAKTERLENIAKTVGTKPEVPTEAKKPQKEFSSTQINLPEEIAAKVVEASKRIPEADLHEEGRENEPHITVKYGLHTNEAKQVREIIENEPPIKAKLGKTSIFPAKGAGEYDVVKVDVDSPDLHRINKLIADALPHTDTHPNYHPHVTLAYVKPGLGEKHGGRADLEGQQLTVDRVIFSDKDRNHIEVVLKGKPSEHPAGRLIVRDIRTGEQTVIPERKTVGEKPAETPEPAKETPNAKETTPTKQPTEQPAQPNSGMANGASEPGTNAPEVSSKPAGKRTVGKRAKPESTGAQPNAGQPTASVSEREPGNATGNGEPRASGPGERELGGGGTTEPVRAEEAKPVAAKPKPEPAPQPERDVNAQNHVIKPEHVLAVRSEKESLANNVGAIKLLKQLEEQTRNATPEEKDQLAKFTGWGGLSQAFDRRKGEAMLEGARPWQRDEAWEKKWGQAYREIKELLTPEEWEAARDTTINAHYTSRDVIQKMWQLVERLGFKGGRVLEPGAGVGHFAGLIPSSVRGETKFSLVELDKISSRLLQKLYPEAHTYGMPLEEFRAAPGSLDLVIGNVPFAKGGPADAKKRYGIDLNLHNYFIARSLDAVKPGGLVVAISTHNTLDAAAEQRKLLATKGELLGAIRLPNDAFKENAKTEVVTDILVFRKPTGTERLGQPFTNTDAVKVGNESGELIEKRVNEYFVAHPEMILGEQAATGSMYGKDEYTVVPTPGNLAEKLDKAIDQLANNLPENVISGSLSSQQVQGEITEAGPEQGTKEGLLRFKDGKLQLATGGAWVEVTPGGKVEGYPAHLFGEAGIKRAEGYIGIRDAYGDLRRAMLSTESTDAEIKAGQAKLREEYDAYVAKHGQLNEGKTSIFQTDPEFYRVLSLEHRRIFRNKDTGAIRYVYEPASVFEKRTLGPREAPTHVGSVKDGLWVSLGYRGGVDADYIAQLTGKTADEVTQELFEEGLAFKDPTTQGLTIRDRYLSGNVREKLRQAEIAEEDDSAYQTNVDALKAVQPERVPIGKVSARLGGNWIPPDVATAFAQRIFNDRYAKAVYGGQGDYWTVIAPKGNAAVEQQWGTSRVDARDILADTLNLKTTKVWDKIPTGEYTESGKEKYETKLNELETVAAKAKQNEMQKAFKKLIDTNTGVATALEDAYNHTFNAYVDPVYNGSHLELPGANTEIELRPYQKNAIWRNLLDRYSLMAHAVGAGKTYTMIATAMEMRRLGLAKRPLLVVQNATLGQFANSFMQMYPNANVMVADKDDLQESNRHLFLSRITSGDWEAIVMAQSTFDRLANNPETAKQFVNDQLAALEEAIHEEGGKNKNSRQDSATVKDLVKARKALQKQLDKILETEKKNEGKNLVHFEDLHADALFLDEAHAYKKPFFITKLDNLVGLNKQASARGVSTMMKVRTIQNLNQGKNVFFATGTPITNTLGEAWHMMNFVAPHVNEDFGVKTFDGFVGAFALKDTVREMNAGGQWVPKDALVKFTNGPELIRYLRAGWDILSPDDLKAYMTQNESALPELKDGKVQAVTVEQTPGVAKLMEFMKEVYARFKAMPARDRREYSYIPAVAYGAAKAGALDIRLVYPESAEEKDSKLNRAVDLIHDEWDRSHDRKGVQLFFSDVFNPRSMDTLHKFMAGQEANIEVQDSGPENAEGEEEQPEREAFLFQELRKKLIAKGIPAGEIAIVGEANTDTKRDVLFERANSGDVRILLGSSAKMGVGVNVQKKLVALHHFDAPWLPADVEQREGRIIRFGNENKEVAIYRYAMKNTLDAAIFTKTIRKAKFIWQALAGKFEGREFDDPASQTTMSIEEQLAAIQGDPLLFLKMDLDRERRDLELEREAHQDQIQRGRSAIRDYQAEIKRYTTETIPNQRKEIEVASEVNPEEPQITYDGKVINDPKDIDQAIKKIREDNEARVLKLTKAKKIAEYQPTRFTAFAEKYFQNLSEGFQIGPYRGTISSGAYEAKSLTGSQGWRTESLFTLNRPGSKQNLYEGNATTGMGLWRAVAGLKERLENSLQQMHERVAQREKEIGDLEAVSGNAWAGQDQLDKVTGRLAEIETELFAKGANTAAPATEDTEGEEKGLPAPALPTKKKSVGSKPKALKAPEAEEAQETTAENLPRASANPAITMAAKFLKGVRQVTTAIRSVTMPMTISAGAKQTSLAFREMMAKKARRIDIANEQMKEVRRYFNQQDDDAKAEFYDGIEHGAKQPDADTQQAADLFREILDGRREEVRALPNGKARLLEYDENYFPHQWEDPDAAKAFLAEWRGQRPLQGNKGWMKRRTIPTIKEGIARGLKLKYSNPVDMVMNKISNLDAYILSQQLLEGELKKSGQVVYAHVTKAKPEGWIELKDPLFQVYGPPTITVSEYVDQDIFNGLDEVLADLGVKHTRKENVGKGRVGVSLTGQDDILTRNATTMSVKAHELGHQIDDKFGMQAIFGVGNTHSQFAAELKAIADLRFEGEAGDNASQKARDYAQTSDEQMADVVAAYVTAPERMKEVAPLTYQRFDRFVKRTPKLRRLAKIKAGLALKRIDYQKAHGGLLKYGSYWAAPGTAHVINNLYADGLSNRFILFRWALSASGVVNMFQLGYSAFHASMTATNAVMGRLTSFAQAASTGHFKTAGKNLLLAPIAPVWDTYMGSKVLQEWRNPGKGGGDLAFVTDAIMSGGSRGQIDAEHAHKFTANVMHFLNHGGFLGKVMALVNAPFAITEQAMRPIMEFLVPYAKAGVAYQKMRLKLEQNPNMTHTQLREKATGVVDAIDNQLGQMVYDNLFWPKWFKESLQFVVRSVGWTLGTQRLLIGAPVDLVKQVGKLAKGQRPELTENMAYAIMLPVLAGAIGSALQLMMCGIPPEDWKDMFYPRTGAKDSEGRWERVSLPTYFKEYYAYATSPIQTIKHKLHPALATALEMISNQDYYGTKIRNEDDPLVQKIIALEKYALKQFIPFSFRGTQKLNEEGATIGEQVLPLIGITPAPASIIKSDAEWLAGELQHHEPGTRTQAQANMSAKRRELVREYQRHGSGANAKISAAVKAGEIKAADARDIIKRAGTNYLENAVKHLSASDSLKVYAKATPTEKARIYWSIQNHIANNLTADVPQKEAWLRELGEPPAEAKGSAAENRAQIKDAQAAFIGSQAYAFTAPAPKLQAGERPEKYRARVQRHKADREQALRSLESLGLTNAEIRKQLVTSAKNRGDKLSNEAFRARLSKLNAHSFSNQ